MASLVAGMGRRASEEGLVSGEVDWKRRCSVAVS